MSDLVSGIRGGDVPAAAAVLAVMRLCAFVLDAFEIIFIIVPILMPPLLVRMADARWVSVLLVLTLQSSFLLPPFGYALMMLRGAARDPVRVLRACACPFLGCAAVRSARGAATPALVHEGEKAPDVSRCAARRFPEIDR